MSLGVQLHDLWRVGNVSLPVVARLYGQANKSIDATRNGDAEIFKQLANPNEMYEDWQQLRHEVQVYLGRSAQNSHEMAEAIIRVAEDYANKDGAAAAELKSLIDEARKGGDVTMPGDDTKYEEPAMPDKP